MRGGAALHRPLTLSLSPEGRGEDKRIGSISLSQKGIKNITVGILSGGGSSERAVSLRSGKAVFEALRRSGYTVRKIDPRQKNSFPSPRPPIGLAFIALHGKGGEDGRIQKLLERRQIPYTGSDPRGSRLAFQKAEAKKLFRRHGVPTPEWKIFSRKNFKSLRRFPAPFFVKPVADGSSIGVFLVEDFERSAERIMQALKRYPRLLAERQIKGREFTVGMLGERALPVIELRPKGKFYDYHCKYTSGMTEYLVPAPIPEAWRRRFQAVARKVHRLLGLRDLSRIDLMADEEGRPFVLEANTIPGFTELSLLPKAAGEAGILFDRLCSRLVKMAWRRWKKNGKA